MILNLITFTLGLLPFLPGPDFMEFVNGIYFFIQIGAIFGLIFIPIGFFKIIYPFFKKKLKRPLRLLPILYITIPLTLITTSFWISDYARDFSRNFAIIQAEPIIKGLEKYKIENNEYPKTINQITPKYLSKIPSDKIIGINGFQYWKEGESFKIEFSQNVILGFNFEIVQYSPIGNYNVEGELIELYDTKQPNWKYFIYD